MGVNLQPNPTSQDEHPNVCCTIAELCSELALRQEDTVAHVWVCRRGLRCGPPELVLWAALGPPQV